MFRGDRKTLATSITLAESTNHQHKIFSDKLLTKTLGYLRQQHHKGYKPTFRIGITGSPGAGKSSLIERLGTHLTAAGNKVAVLTVDPSSVITGGSLLGDKTRMIQLARDPNAYIRPSPSAGTLGGVAKKTNEAIILCEAAGYNIILVETVGIGQSEISVADMVDMFVLVIPPASGDELQGIKKGIIEMVDLILVSKADGDLLPAAKRIQSEYISALKLLRRPGDKWVAQVHPVSSLHNEGFEKAWEKMQEFHSDMVANGLFYSKRRQQYKAWMWSHIQNDLMVLFKSHYQVEEDIKKYERLVQDEMITPSFAANRLLRLFTKK